MLSRQITAIIISVGLLITLAACGGDSSGSEGGTAQDFPIMVYQGQEALGANSTTFHQVLAQGKPVVLNFWAGQCPPCREEMPDLQDFHSEYSDRVLLFGVDVGPFTLLGTPEDGKALLDELEITYAAGSTEDGGVIRAYGVQGMPSTIFIKPDGEIHRKWIGLISEDKLEELAEDLLAS
jgi:thiol-disulfide isomerase/thioredoxin